MKRTIDIFSSRILQLFTVVGSAIIVSVCRHALQQTAALLFKSSPFNTRRMADHEKKNAGGRGGFSNRKRRYRGATNCTLSNVHADPHCQTRMTLIAAHSAEGTKSLCMSSCVNSFSQLLNLYGLPYHCSTRP